jgi:hypothetical protein
MIVSYIQGLVNPGSWIGEFMHTGEIGYGKIFKK